MILSSRCLPASSSEGLRLSYKTPQKAKKFWRPLFLFHLRRITPPECRRRDRWPRRVPMRHGRPSKGRGRGKCLSHGLWGIKFCQSTRLLGHLAAGGRVSRRPGVLQSRPVALFQLLRPLLDLVTADGHPGVVVAVGRLLHVGIEPVLRIVVGPRPAADPHPGCGPGRGSRSRRPVPG